MEQSSVERQVVRLIAAYSESHLNLTNEVIHFICVPAIVFSVLGLVWVLHPVAAFSVVALSLFYYATLSTSFAMGMLLMSGAMLGLLSILPQDMIFSISLSVFVVAWIGQFIGHKIEGKKPSFFDDLRYLLIGRLFVLSFLYRRLRVAY